MCSAVLARISLCNTLKIAQPDDRSAPRRFGNILSSMLKQISCASCRSTAPCLDKSAGCPRTFFTSSVSNSGLTTFAHVPNRIVNQSCHALAGGKRRKSCRSWHFRKFDSRNVWFAGPDNTLLKSSTEGFSGSAVASPPASSGKCGTVNSLSLSSERGSEWVHPCPGHGGGNCDDAVP